MKSPKRKVKWNKKKLWLKRRRLAPTYFLCLCLQTWNFEQWKLRTLILKLHAVAANPWRNPIKPKWTLIGFNSNKYILFSSSLHTHSHISNTNSFLFNLLQKLNLNGPKASRNFNDSDDDAPNSILGNIKIQFFLLGGACFVYKNHAASIVL